MLKALIVGGAAAVCFWLAGQSKALAADDWKIENDSCMGVYAMLVENDASVDALLPKSAGIDYGARLKAVKAKSDPFEVEMAETYKSAFTLNYLKGRIDGDRDLLFNTLKVALLCDQKYGFTPVLGSDR